MTDHLSRILEFQSQLDIAHQTVVKLAAELTKQTHEHALMLCEAAEREGALRSQLIAAHNKNTEFKRETFRRMVALSGGTPSGLLAGSPEKAMRLTLRLTVKRAEAALQRCARLTQRSMFNRTSPAAHLLTLRRREQWLRQVLEEARAKLEER